MYDANIYLIRINKTNFSVIITRSVNLYWTLPFSDFASNSLPPMKFSSKITSNVKTKKEQRLFKNRVLKFLANKSKP